MDTNKLRTRVEALLKTNESFIDAEDVAESLQKKFPDYSRLKVSALKKKLEGLLPAGFGRWSTADVAEIPAPPTESVQEEVGPSAPKRVRRAANCAVTPSSGSLGFSPSPRPWERLEDVCGLDRRLSAQLTDLVVLPLRFPDLYARLLGGSSACSGLLLCGAGGTGKSLLGRALAGETGASFFPVNATELVCGVSGDSEQKLRALFDAARDAAPSLLLLDDIDSICPRSGGGRELERRIVAQLNACLDGLEHAPGIVVVATTSRPEALDASLRRSGRFDTEISIGMPDLEGRAAILSRLAGRFPSGDLDISELAKLTAGYVGADLVRLAKEAGLAAAKRAINDCANEEEVLIQQVDFLTAIPRVQPSSRREGFSTVPSVTWDDVGALSSLKAELDDTICLPIRQAPVFAALLGGGPGTGSFLGGALLFGPPGCGKTLLAKAVANASGASFISVKGPELLNKYVGESERAVRQVFQRAANSSPCVIFFDEIDALCPRRNAENTGAQERVVNQMLTEMDGATGIASGVFVIAATNRPDMVDSAMLRPGRLGKLLYVPLPDEDGREDILRTLLRHTPCQQGLDISSLAKSAVRFSGADLNALFREAIASAVKRIDSGMATEENSAQVTSSDFQLALSKVKASVTEEAERSYLQLQKMQSVSK